MKDIESVNRYEDSFKSLNTRPDWDGYLTLDEANEWYRNGNGQPLYVSLEKINLDGLVSLGEDYVGKKYTFNLLYGASLKAADGLVYGNLTFKRYPIIHVVRMPTLMTSTISQIRTLQIG